MIPLKGIYFIGIAGGSASGKTTVASKLSEFLGTDKSSIINLDCYYNDLSGIPAEAREKKNFDHPDSIDLNLLSSHLNQLSTGMPISLPHYDFVTHTRKAETEVFIPKEYVILEGLFTLAIKKIRSLLKYKIYVNASDDVRLIRRIMRDTNERNRNIDSIINQYLNSVKKMHNTIIEPSKKYADSIINWDNYDLTPIKTISKNIKYAKKRIK